MWGHIHRLYNVARIRSSKHGRQCVIVHMVNNGMFGTRMDTFLKGKKKMRIIRIRWNSTQRNKDRLERHMRIKARGNSFLSSNEHLYEIFHIHLVGGCHQHFLLLDCYWPCFPVASLFYRLMVTITTEGAWRNRQKKRRLIFLFTSTIPMKIRLSG